MKKKCGWPSFVTHSGTSTIYFHCWIFKNSKTSNLFDVLNFVMLKKNLLIVGNILCLRLSYRLPWVSYVDTFIGRNMIGIRNPWKSVIYPQKFVPFYLEFFSSTIVFGKSITCSTLLVPDGFKPILYLLLT